MKKFFVTCACWFVCLFCVFMVLHGCQEESSTSLTMPSIPTSPLPESSGEESESYLPGNFYAGRNSECQLEARAGREEFKVSIPAGDFRISYTTWVGTFHAAARATECATLTIGLNPCDEVKEVVVQSGTISDIGCPTWTSGPVTLYSWPCGGTAECSRVFSADASAPVTVLSGGGGSTDPMPSCDRNPVPCQGNDCPSSSAPVSVACSSRQEGGRGITSTYTEIFEVNMGQTSGTFDFYYQTYTVPDRMVVEYEGRELFNTGCTGARDTVSLNFAGASSVITVRVTSLCSWGGNTDWDFIVSCPE